MPPLTMGPNRPIRSGFGSSARSGWGVAPVRGGNTIMPAEAKRRIANLRMHVRKNATRMLKEAGEILAKQWRENIEGMGWGPNGFGDALDAEDEARFASLGLQEAKDVSRSTGRYYRSIAVEVDSELEVHVGSTIPRPSGRSLRSWSYPEALEYGTSTAEAYPTLRPAIDEAGPAMQDATDRVHRVLLQRFLMGGA